MIERDTVLFPESMHRTEAPGTTRFRVLKSLCPSFSTHICFHPSLSTGSFSLLVWTIISCSPDTHRETSFSFSVLASKFLEKNLARPSLGQSWVEHRPREDEADLGHILTLASQMGPEQQGHAVLTGPPCGFRKEKASEQEQNVSIT